jgi:uncharacterized membrane protein
VSGNADAVWIPFATGIGRDLHLIMLGQNIQGRHAETRAENDLEVNIKAERETEVILRYLEYQNRALIAMLETLGVGLDEALRTAKA